MPATEFGSNDPPPKVGRARRSSSGRVSEPDATVVAWAVVVVGPVVGGVVVVGRAVVAGAVDGLEDPTEVDDDAGELGWVLASLVSVTGGAVVAEPEVAPSPPPLLSPTSTTMAAAGLAGAGVGEGVSVTTWSPSAPDSVEPADSTSVESGFEHEEMVSTVARTAAISGLERIGSL